ncbi:MAG: helix-hairpin-helix domain-containing protein, partial [Liquorilactobacillus satsumensis]|uniref:helix-hairpin-helix domain-containing protein n=1 Tax=Liquorilactobacillus satsumensis TaxID=259059 RepID=UPI0039E9A22F
HLQGTDPVAAMICFIEGRPDKDQNRKYKLKTVTHADEAASTREVIRRRYSRLLKEHAQLPDLILMDGGIVQVEAVIDVLQNELNLSIPVAGMVKDEHHKTAALMNAAFQKVPLDPKSEGFYLLQRIQDEVHRFAITFHRKAHSKNSLSSRLDLIPGVGPKSRTKLLRKFGSMKKITEAPVNEIQALGISKKVAQMIKLSLK